MRGQTELLGVIFIIIILSLGFVFLVGTLKPGTSQEFFTSQEAQASLGAVLEHNSRCGPLRHVIKACADQDNICPGTDPCHFAGVTMASILGETISSYYIRASRDDFDYVSVDAGCSQDNTSTNGVAFIYSQEGPIIVTLGIC